MRRRHMMGVSAFPVAKQQGRAFAGHGAFEQGESRGLADGNSLPVPVGGAAGLAGYQFK